VKAFREVPGEKVEYGFACNVVDGRGSDVAHMREVIEDIAALGVFYVNAVRQGIDECAEQVTVAGGHFAEMLKGRDRCFAGRGLGVTHAGWSIARRSSSSKIGRRHPLMPGGKVSLDLPGVQHCSHGLPGINVESARKKS